MALVLTSDQAAIITSLEAPMEEAFANGVTVTGGSPATLPAFDGYSKMKSSDKDLAKNSVKTMFAAYTAVGNAAPSYTTVSSYQNGYGAWGDGNYSAGVVRYYKDIMGEVHIQGLVKAPASPGGFQVMFTMPVGFRPAPNDAQIFPAAHNDAPCVVEAHWNGNVSFRGTPIANGWIALTIRYRAGG